MRTKLLHPLQALNPLDGRYRSDITDLVPYFSEQALMRYRLQVEVAYLMALAQEPKIKGLRKFSSLERQMLSHIVDRFDLKAAEQIKALERTTQHDVKAVEYYLK